jgi:hypothetical protein
MTASGLGTCRSALLGAAGLALLGGAALAEDAPTPAPNDAGSTMIGTWEFSNADHDKVCHFNFRGDPVTGGSKLEVDRNCPSYFPSTKDIVGWALDSYGGLRLLDAHGNAVIELTEAESGIYDGFAPGEGRFVLQSAAVAPVHTAEEMVGDWAIARGTGKPICLLTLANDPPGADTLALKVKPGCDAFVVRFGPTGWRMSQGELVLLSARGQTWRFEANDANTWQRVPEGANPVLLVRQ